MTLVNNGMQQKASLWREALRVFNLYSKEWFPIAAVFCGVLIVLHMASSYYIPADNDTLTALTKKKSPSVEDYKQVMAAVFNPAAIVIGLAIFALITIQQYIFIMFFSTKIQLSRTETKPTVNGFFRMWWALIRLGLLYGAILAGGSAVSVLLALLTKVSAFYVLIAVAIVYAVYILLKYHLVSVLAANGVKAPFKVSARLMQGNYWRILGNGFVISVLLFIPFMIAIFVISFVAILLFGHLPDSEAPSFAANIVINTISAIFSIIMSGISCAYAVACVSILNREKKAQNPQPTPAAV